jgi:hypothetical protein
MAQTVPRKTKPVGPILALGDYLCIILFAIIGLQAHGEPITLGGILRNALPILLVWWMISPFLRTYTKPTWKNLLYTWAIAVSVGLWLRFLILERTFELSYLIFWAVALGATLVLLLAWRLLARVILRRSRT